MSFKITKQAGNCNSPGQLPFTVKLSIFTVRMKRIRPRALRRNGVIGICAPASPPFRVSDLRDGIRYLEGLGFRVELGRHLYRRDGYLAGTDSERAGDLNALFSDRRVDAVIALRGGYGSTRVLPLLDYRAIKRNPKIFVGYSDLTAVQMALYGRCGLVSFAGPMVAGGMSRGLTGYAEELFWALLTSTRAVGTLRGTRLSAVRRGTANGVLLGGNLSMLCHLTGTPYLPATRNALVFFEDIGERPYRIDRMLQHLRLSGFFGGVRGVLLGKFSDCAPEKGKPSLTLRRVFADHLGDLTVPVLEGVHHGHVRGSLTMPVGARVEIRSGRGTVIAFNEPAVS